jgi:hypothetical protein
MKEFTAILVDVWWGALPLASLGGFIWGKVTHSKKHTESDK